MRRWDTALIGLDAVIADSPPLSPTAIGAAGRSDLAVVIRFDGERVSVEPPDRVLYDPDDAAVLDVGMPPPAALAAAERVEFGGDHAGAARKYQQRLQRATRASRPALLLRLARTFQKGGRVDDALAQYQALALISEDAPGSLPAALAARFETCSLIAGVSPAQDGSSSRGCALAVGNT